MSTIVPIDQIDPETLYRLVEEFVSREGTDYGHTDIDLGTKVKQVMGALYAGDAVIAFDERLNSATIIPNPAIKR